MVIHFATLSLGIAATFLRVVLENEFCMDLELSYCLKLLPSLFLKSSEVSSISTPRV